MKTIFKRTIIVVLCMTISVFSFGQEKKQYSDEIKVVKVSPPRFIGNEELLTVLNETQFGSLNDYLKNHIQIPEKSKNFQEEGTEVIQFVVTTKGEVTGFNIINSLSKEIDQEVIRVLKTTNGLWRPGLNNGEPVATEKELSITFNIVDNENKFDTNFFEMAKWFYTKGNRQLFVKENLKGALKNYNKATQYLPNDKCLLAARGICRYELGDKNGACNDWNRIKALGGLESGFYLDKFCEHKGYSEMISTLKEQE